MAITKMFQHHADPVTILDMELYDDPATFYAEQSTLGLETILEARGLAKLCNLPTPKQFSDEQFDLLAGQANIYMEAMLLKYHRQPVIYERFDLPDLWTFIVERGLVLPSVASCRTQHIEVLEAADRDMTFRFMELPAELRNMVYSLCLTASAPIVRHKQPAITHANNEIRAESLPFFYSNNAFTFGYVCHKGWMRPHSDPTIMYPTGPERYWLYELSPSIMHHITTIDIDVNWAALSNVAGVSPRHKAGKVSLDFHRNASGILKMITPSYVNPSMWTPHDIILGLHTGDHDTKRWEFCAPSQFGDAHRSIGPIVDAAVSTAKERGASGLGAKEISFLVRDVAKAVMDYIMDPEGE